MGMVKTRIFHIELAEFDCLFQMAVIFGSVPLEQLAQRLGSSLLVQPFYAGFDLVKFVRSLSTGAFPFLIPGWLHYRNRLSLI